MAIIKEVLDLDGNPTSPSPRLLSLLSRLKGSLASRASGRQDGLDELGLDEQGGGPVPTTAPLQIPTTAPVPIPTTAPIPAQNQAPDLDIPPRPGSPGYSEWLMRQMAQRVPFNGAPDLDIPGFLSPDAGPVVGSSGSGQYNPGDRVPTTAPLQIPTTAPLQIPTTPPILAQNQAPDLDIPPSPGSPGYSEWLMRQMANWQAYNGAPDLDIPGPLFPDAGPVAGFPGWGQLNPGDRVPTTAPLQIPTTEPLSIPTTAPVLAPNQAPDLDIPPSPGSPGYAEWLIRQMANWQPNNGAPDLDIPGPLSPDASPLVGSSGSGQYNPTTAAPGLPRPNPGDFVMQTAPLAIPQTAPLGLPENNGAPDLDIYGERGNEAELADWAEAPNLGISAMTGQYGDTPEILSERVRQGTAVGPASLDALLPRLGMEDEAATFDPNLAYLASSFPIMASMLAEQASVEDQLAQALSSLNVARSDANSVSLSDHADFIRAIGDNPQALDMYSSMNQYRGDYLNRQEGLVAELAQRQNELNAETSSWEILFQDIVGTKPPSDPYDMEAEIMLALENEATGLGESSTIEYPESYSTNVAKAGMQFTTAALSEGIIRERMPDDLDQSARLGIFKPVAYMPDDQQGAAFGDTKIVAHYGNQSRGEPISVGTDGRPIMLSSLQPGRAAAFDEADTGERARQGVSWELAREIEQNLGIPANPLFYPVYIGDLWETDPHLFKVPGQVMDAFGPGETVRGSEIGEDDLPSNLREGVTLKDVVEYDGNYLVGRTPRDMAKLWLVTRIWSDFDIDNPNPFLELRPAQQEAVIEEILRTSKPSYDNENTSVFSLPYNEFWDPNGFQAQAATAGRTAGLTAEGPFLTVDAIDRLRSGGGAAGRTTGAGGAIQFTSGG